MKEIIFTISADGSSVKVDANGYTDNSCADVERKIQLVIGTKSGGNKKPEFYSLNSTGINIGGCYGDKI